jgi:outer membrane lipoprotein-sorting protein
MRNTPSRRIPWVAFVFVFLNSTCFLIAAESRLLQKVRQAIRAIQPFRVAFSQQVAVEGEEQILEKGIITFRDPAMIKWHYLDPEDKIFLLEKERYQFYSPEQNQLIRGPVGKQNETILWQLLFADALAPRIHCEEKQRTISIRQDREDEPAVIIKIKIGPDFLPESAVQTDAYGAVHTFRFHDFQFHVLLAANEFVLDVPANVEIIEQ